MIWNTGDYNIRKIFLNTMKLTEYVLHACNNMKVQKVISVPKKLIFCVTIQSEDNRIQFYQSWKISNHFKNPIKMHFEISSIPFSKNLLTKNPKYQNFRQKPEKNYRRTNYHKTDYQKPDTCFNILHKDRT